MGGALADPSHAVVYCWSHADTETEVFESCAWHELTILPAERMTISSREILERHLEGAPDSCIHVMDLARETVRR